MIVRIVNENEQMDRFFDCVSTNMSLCTNPAAEGRNKSTRCLVLGFDTNEDSRRMPDVTLDIVEGDVIYYMNSDGKTFNCDRKSQYRAVEPNVGT